MRGARATTSLFLGVALAFATAPPALAEDTATLSMTLYTVGDTGAPFDNYVGVGIQCVGSPEEIHQDARATADGWTEDILSLGTVPAGTHCDFRIIDPPSTWTATAHLDHWTWDPGSSVDLVAGPNNVKVSFSYVPGGEPQAQVEVTVTGYTGGSWEPFSGTIDCISTPDAQPIAHIEFGVGPEGPVSTSTQLELPYPARCGVTSFEPGYPGDEAYWGEWRMWPDDWFEVQLGANPIAVEIERWFAGEWPPADDTWDEQTFDTFTVDRVFVNRYGAITVEGSLSCSPVNEGDLGATDWVLVNVNWDAIQYVGRKTAIHASWDSGIATPCWMEGSAGPFTWQTLYPYPQGGVQWVSGVDGKFGTSTIHIDANASGGYQLISQRFDPAGTWVGPEGSPIPYEEACEDNNGDGFCVVSHAYYGWAAADLKPISQAKPPRK